MNLNNFKRFLKSKKILKILCLPLLFIIHVICNIKFVFRKIFNTKHTKKIAKLKCSMENKRCFIVATGPSLKNSDLEMIKKEYCFSMNSIIYSMKESNFVPNFYAIQDEYVYEKISSELEKCEKIDTIYISDAVNKICKTKKEKVIFNLDYLSHKYNKKRMFTKFSSKCEYKIYDGYTITYTLIQIAVYMGFKDIYLLGVDCNYSGDKTHVIDFGYVEPEKEMSAKRMIAAYKVAKEYCDNNNVHIYNATRGGKLEVFPRVRLEDIVQIKKEN